MAVYERGYRTYNGDFSGAPAWYVIYRENYRLAFSSWGFRILGLLFLIWFVIWGAGIYFTLGIADNSQRMSRGMAGQQPWTAAVQLKQMLLVFYGGVSILTGLLAILVGSGLISGDLRARALPLYLVRPIRSWEYVLGKALVLPRVLLWTCLAPGLIYYLLVGVWRPPGESAAWLADNLDIIESIFMHYITASVSYTGLMLFLSARTERGGAVVSMAAAILFAGSLLSVLMSQLDGVGQVMKYAGIPLNTVAGITRNSIEATWATQSHSDQLDEVLSHIPTPTGALLLGIVLLGLGVFGALRRARTVEVSA
jgi:ABC-type transport system involved in multi-copper enzyme maturation permease subunit